MLLGNATASAKTDAPTPRTTGPAFDCEGGFQTVGEYNGKYVYICGEPLDEGGLTGHACLGEDQFESVDVFYTKSTNDLTVVIWLTPSMTMSFEGKVKGNVWKGTTSYMHGTTEGPGKAFKLILEDWWP